MTASTVLPLEPDDELGRRILDAAVSCFATFGVRRTTMEDVATTAGIGRATLYRRFDGRDDLVRATVQREMARFVAAVDAQLRHVDDPVERFVEGFVAMLGTARSHPLLTRLLQLDEEFVLPFLTVDAGPILSMCRDHLARELRAAQRRGRVHADVRAGLAAELLVRLCHSLLLSPEGLIAADDPDGLRALARQHLAPALFTTEDAR